MSDVSWANECGYGDPQILNDQTGQQRNKALRIHPKVKHTMLCGTIATASLLNVSLQVAL